jgi:hypothetical protein
MAEFTFFLSAHGVCLKGDHILGHKTSFSKFKRIEMLQDVFFDKCGINVEVNDTHKGKSPHT